MKKWQEKCNYRRIKDKDGVVLLNVITIDGQEIPVSDEVYEAYSRMGRQERYQEEVHSVIPHVSLEKMANACVPVEIYMLHHAPSAENVCIERQEKLERDTLLRMLPDAISQLTEDEQELVRALYFEGFSTRQYAQKCEVYQRAVIYRRDKALNKLMDIIKNLL